jgi:hypothetical protein
LPFSWIYVSFSGRFPIDFALKYVHFQGRHSGNPENSISKKSQAIKPVKFATIGEYYHQAIEDIAKFENIRVPCLDFIGYTYMVLIPSNIA